MDGAQEHDQQSGSPVGAATDKADAADTKSRRQWTLPAWLDHFNKHDLKIVFRCWAAAWVATVLIFIQPSLNNLQLAAFFASLLLFIVPPANILFVYLLAALSLLLGMCVAWAWGLLTMKAALAARPTAETGKKLLALQNAAVAQAKQTGRNATWEAQVLVHEGFMLDARVSAVFFVMCCIFIYALARIRLANPKLVLFQMFGTIIIDIFLLIGPTLPSFTADLGSILVKPGAIGIGLGVICCLLFFPQSTSYAVMDKMEKLVLLGNMAMTTTRKRLSDQPVPLAELLGARAKVIGVYKAMEPAVAFLPLDFSRGRWNAEDVKQLQEPIRVAMLANLSIIDFHVSRAYAAAKEERLEKEHENRHAGQDGDGQSIGLRQLQDSADLMYALRNPEHGEVRQNTRKALHETSADVLTACSESIELAAKCINMVNTRRWIGQPSQEEFDQLAHDLETKMAELRSTREKFVTTTTDNVLETHKDLFDSNGELKPPAERGTPLLRGVVVSMVIEERIFSMAVAMDKLLQFILQLLSKRKTHRIWFPFRLRYAFNWLMNSKTAVPVAGLPADAADDPDDAADILTAHDQAEEARRRLRVSRGDYAGPPRKSRSTRVIAATYKWFTNPGAMYALRMVIVTVVTAIPAVIPHSAGFFYREKGIWGVISAQTCMLVYMADLTFSIVARGTGTVIGGVMGMLAWYIGSGSGIGNPYGLAAISAVMVLILIWWRIFLPPAYAPASIMSGATFALVIGFSYDNHHIVQYGLPGIGYEAFWKRLVTVLLGFVASVIVQVFPKPPSATKHVAKTLANTLGTLADHYALLLSHWGHETSQNRPLKQVNEKISLDVAEVLLALNPTIALLKIEVSFGPFDQTSMQRVQRLCQAMNQSLARLLDLSTTLPKELQERFNATVGFQDDRVVGDIMAILGILEQSLRTGSPLPERLPAPLIRNFYSWWREQHRNAMLSKDLVRNENYRRYCVAVSAYLRFLSAVDDMILVLKEAVGECHIVREWETV